MLAGEARILVCPCVIPGPAIETTLGDMRHVVRDEVVAQRVTLVYRGPQLACLGMHRDAGRIANTGGVDSLARAVRIELEHIGAIRFRLVLRDIGMGATPTYSFLPSFEKTKLRVQ